MSWLKQLANQVKLSACTPSMPSLTALELGLGNGRNPDFAAGRLRPGYVIIEAGSLATRQRQPLGERTFVLQHAILAQVIQMVVG